MWFATFVMAIFTVFGALTPLQTEETTGTIASTRTTYYFIQPSSMPQPSPTTSDESKKSVTDKTGLLDPLWVLQTVGPSPQAEPEAEPTLDITPSSETQPDPCHEAEADPEAENKAFPDHEAVSIPEPRPHWKSAIPQWGLAWTMHVYVLPTAFTALAAWSLSLMVRRKRCAFQKRYYSIIQLLMLLASTMRAIYLFVDPYGSGGCVPNVILVPLYGCPWSLLTVGFSILFVALVDLSRVSLVTLGSKFLTWKTVSMIGASQLILNMAVDLFLALGIAPHFMTLICQGALILWSILVFIGFWFVGKKIISTVRASYHSTARIARNVVQLKKSNSFTRVLQNEEAEDAKSIVLRVVTIAYGSSITGLLLAMINIYDLLASSSYIDEEKDGYANPWAWWARQSCLRVAELVLISLLLYATTDPKRPALLCTFARRLGQAVVGLKPSTSVKGQGQQPAASYHLNSGTCIE